MKAAIYARYSSQNQRPESIADQILSCRKEAQRRGFIVLDDHVYADEALSGASWDRPALVRFRQAASEHRFDVALVDDLSRLARDNYFMLGLLRHLDFHGIRVISVADGVDTKDPHSRLSIQLSGILNEHQLHDLREKTLRGQIGQKERGFTMGEATFGYRSYPVGTIRYDKAGRPRPEGHRMRIDPAEALVIVRIFESYAAGESVSAIVRALNEEKVPGRYRSSKGWSTGSVTRILDNEKYSGWWIWNKHGYRRDPQTGRRHCYEKPRDEWIVDHDEEAYQIVSPELWDKVRARRDEVRETYPAGKGGRGFSPDQRGRVRVFPESFLSGAMECGICHRAIGLVGGRHGGYYGCLAARNRACSNRVKVRRSLAEKIILAAVQERLADPAAIHYVFCELKTAVAKLDGDVPELIRRKKAQLGVERRRRDNLVDFVAEGRESAGIGERLAQTEQKLALLEAQIAELTRSVGRIWVPSLKWVEKRCAQLRELLDSGSPTQSALVLRAFVAPITLEPVVPASGRPYYLARTSFDTLKLLENLDPDGGPDPGATSIGWWTARGSSPAR